MIEQIKKMRTKLKALLLGVGMVIVVTLILIFLVSAPRSHQDPLVFVTFIGHTNAPDGAGVSTFSISNASNFPVNRRAMFTIFDMTDPPEDALAAQYRVLQPHEIETIDVEDPPASLFPPGHEAPRWKLKVACVSVPTAARSLLDALTGWARDHEIPAPKPDISREHCFTSGWTVPEKDVTP